MTPNLTSLADLFAPEQTTAGPVYVLVVAYGDMSGIRHVWGPFTTEEAAATAWDELAAIGVEGRGMVRQLQQSVPSTATPIRVTTRKEPSA